MGLYLIERTFAERLDLTVDDVRLIEEVNADVGVNWLFSFLSVDRHRSYCLYEAPSPEPIIEAARQASVPVDSVIEVSRFVPAEMRAARPTQSPPFDGLAEPSGPLSPRRQ